MPKTFDPFRLLLFAMAGWMNQQQQQVIDYLREENQPKGSAMISEVDEA